MPKSLNSPISIFYFLFFHLFISTDADDTCPYPCIPPPIAGTTNPTTPSAGFTPYSPPPPPPLYYSPPAGYGGGMIAPPPPDAILPYFPYYYRNGIRGSPSDQSSSSTSLPLATRWTAGIVFVVASFCSVLVFS